MKQIISRPLWNQIESGGGRCPIRVWGGPVKPATVVKVKAPLNGRVCGRACLGSYDPALVPEALSDY